jgi:histidine triad (HIT) family protein
MTSQTPSDCLFCKIVAGDIPSDRVAESERSIAFRDISPAAPIHVLVVPKRHEPTVGALAAAAGDDLADVFLLAARPSSMRTCTSSRAPPSPRGGWCERRERHGRREVF